MVVSSVSDSRTIPRQWKGDMFSPLRPMCVDMCRYRDPSATVWGKAEANRWRSGSFVSRITPYCDGPTLEYAFGEFGVFVFSMECAPYMWLRWSFPVDGKTHKR